MPEYILTSKAVDDLSDIWNYTYETWSEEQADRYYFLLIGACRELANGVIAGKKYPEVHEEILGYKAGKHIIFYRIIKESDIEIVRILHGRMDLRVRMQEM
ncbi:MAG TPA: type II toxin-antitoxin system RelE/ParE family toxin [Phnomibacter sp.]|nr:type II toxin-antitoxin system RelE/ParE family toxin [Phnomibacter sp.]